MFSNKVSVIVPCYNSRKTIKRALQSILKQTFNNIDIIVVDDQSTDGTLQLLEQLSLSEPRIRIISNTINLGPDYSRFIGLKSSDSTYVCFLDADDTMTPNAIESLYTVAEKEKADIVEGSSTRIIGRTGLLKRKSYNQDRIITQPELMNNFFISFFGVNILSVTLWGKLYRKSLFEVSGIEPSGHRRGEDLVMNMRLFPFIRKYVTINQDVIHYYYGGMTSNFDHHFYDCSKEQYWMKLAMISQYSYWKAQKTTRIEMCNILNTTVKQMLLARESEQDIHLFLEKEATSGFLDEITTGLESFLPIKKKDIDAIIASQDHNLWMIRTKRFLLRLASKLI